MDTLLNSEHNMHIELENGVKIRSAIWDAIIQKKCEFLYQMYEVNKSQDLWQKTLNTGSEYLLSIDTLRLNATLTKTKLELSGRPAKIINIILKLLYDSYEEDPNEIKVGRAILEMDKIRDMLWVDLVQNRQLLDITNNQLHQIQRENKIRKKIAALELQYAQNEDSSSLNQRIVELQDDLLMLNENRRQAKTASLSSPTELLKEIRERHDMSLSFFITENSLYRNYIAADTALMLRTAWTDEMDDLILNFSEVLSEQSSNPNSLVQFVSNMLLDGIPLKSSGSLCIYPDGILNRLPFEILNDNEGEYLINSYSISYNSSIKRLIRLNSKTEYENDLVAFAPNYDNWSFTTSDVVGVDTDAQILRSEIGNLPSAVEEAKNVSSFFNSNLYLKESATLDNFLLASEGARILHMSMHALSNEAFSQFSRLVFSADSTEAADSRYFYASEIAVQSIPAEMVVLSACNTGTGKFIRGDGVLSLARAFEYAGAHSTVHSLWRIPDASTREIMESFYLNLSKGKEKNTALKNAKINYIENHKNTNLAHPFYWSGFILSGDTSVIEADNDSYLAIIFIFGIVLLLLFVINQRKKS